MNRIVLVFLLLNLGASLAGCAPADPNENLKWHFSKALKFHNDSAIDIKQVPKDDPDVEERGKWWKVRYTFDETSATFVVNKSDSPETPFEGVVEFVYYGADFPTRATREDAESMESVEAKYAGRFRAKYNYKQDKWRLSAVERWSNPPHLPFESGSAGWVPETKSDAAGLYNVFDFE
jgi:hypothetical protein